MAKSFGESRILRLNDLTPDQRRLVLALIEAKKASEPESVVDEKDPVIEAALERARQ